MAVPGSNPCHTPKRQRQSVRGRSMPRPCTISLIWKDIRMKRMRIGARDIPGSNELIRQSPASNEPAHKCKALVFLRGSMLL